MGGDGWRGGGGIEEITYLQAWICEELYPAKQITGDRNHLR
jgi:hypothetical protein